MKCLNIEYLKMLLTLNACLVFGGLNSASLVGQGQFC